MTTRPFSADARSVNLDSRDSARRPLTIKVRVVSRSGAVYTGQAGNISASGILVRDFDTAPTNEKDVEIVLEWSNGSDSRTLRVPARAVRAAPDGVAFRFVHRDTAVYTDLIDLVYAPH